MKKILLLITIVMLGTPIVAQTNISVTPIVIDLWPDGAPNDNGATGPEQILENGRIANITRPTLTVYPAKNGNGMAIIACPGGAYVRLAMNHEGHDMAPWFNNQGITYAVLKYRMPNGQIEVPLSDALQAIKIMREKAEEWNVDPNKVGIMGSSAGGNLASTVATHFTSKANRPDFQILFYAFMTMDPYMSKTMLGEDASQERIDLYTNIKQVTASTPPAFLLTSADDRTVSCDNSILYFQALRSHGIEASLHIYPSGGHGWGFKDSFRYKRQWTGELEQWLRGMNLNLTQNGSRAEIIQQKTIEEGGTGPYKAIAAKVSTLEDYVIYRPSDLEAAVKAEGKALPLTIFGNGACSDNSVYYEKMLSEIASHGYIVIALGELRMDNDQKSTHTTRSSQMIYAIDWMEQQVADLESEYYGMVDMSRLASAGHSCGGAQVLATAADSRMKTHILYNSGIGNMSMAGVDSTSLSKLHAPILYMPGGPEDVATANAEIDYTRIGHVPVVFADHLTAGHGGDFANPRGGSYGRLSLAWFDWFLKGNKGRAKIFLKGNTRDYSEFTIKSKNF